MGEKQKAALVEWKKISERFPAFLSPGIIFFAVLETTSNYADDIVFLALNIQLYTISSFKPLYFSLAASP